MAEDRMRVRAAYPFPRRMDRGIGFFTLRADAAIRIENLCDKAAADLLREHIAGLCGIALPVMSSENTRPGDIVIGRAEGSAEPESYEISIAEGGVRAAGADKRGAIYAVQTLVQLTSVTGEILSLPIAEIRDRPKMPVRGAHVYLPARKSVEEFKRIVRALAFVKMNTLIVEVGGGMEYARHPEINAAWEKLCRDAHAYPGGPRAIQASEAYWKDSMHTEVGGGSFLTKAEVRGIAEYAKALGFDVIPEVQSLSHSYYLTMAHHGISERPQEPWPDSWCPSNPKSYELYFDVAEEVLEVFRPETVSIGHDEVRILGECPLCKGKSGEELLAGDVGRLYEFYSSRGVRTMMWGEMLQRFRGYDGLVYGGVFEEKTDLSGRYWRVPDTYKAIDMVPNDILILDWYHCLGATEQGFLEKGFTELYGNFEGAKFADFEKRSSIKNVLGGEVSTWCLADAYTMARDNRMHDFVFSAGMLWQDGYTDAGFEAQNRAVMGVMPQFRSIAAGRRTPLDGGGGHGLRFVFTGEGGPDMEFDWSAACCHYRNRLPELLRGKDAPAVLFGVPLGGAGLEIPVDARAASLVFLHAVRKPMGFIPSYEFADMSNYVLGRYTVEYEDGTAEEIPLHYGVHIGHYGMGWGRSRSAGDGKARSVDQLHLDQEAGEKSMPPYYRLDEPWMGSLLYFTSPVLSETPEGARTVFAYEWMNPRPDAKISSVRAFGASGHGERKAHLFGVAVAQAT